MAFGFGSGSITIHHLDRGSQYASEGFCLLLEQEQILQSMSRKGRVPIGRTTTTLWPSPFGRRSNPNASTTSAMAFQKHGSRRCAPCSTTSNSSPTRSACIRPSDTNRPPKGTKLDTMKLHTDTLHSFGGRSPLVATQQIRKTFGACWSVRAPQQNTTQLRQQQSAVAMAVAVFQDGAHALSQSRDQTAVHLRV